MAKILPLAEMLLISDEKGAASFFLCAFWASVSRKRVKLAGGDERVRFLPPNMIDTCIAATVNWAKVALAHRAYHCNPTCTDGPGRGYLWDYTRKWDVMNDWFTATSGIALAYDVLYADMTPVQRRVVRSAVALLVLKRYSWGNSPSSDRDSPNAVLHPHRIFSNWAMYHSNLYIANLAIEGDTDFDTYASAVLESEGEAGFNAALNTRFTAMIKAYMAHSIYPDGSTFEDGYSYFIAFREGSLGAVAAHRRGVATIDTPRFRNFIHNAAQMYEPWQCGSLIGHAGGGGLGYPSHIGLFRYAYPKGALTNMMWRQRMHPEFKVDPPCRILWFQTMVQMTFFGDEHGTSAESLETMETDKKNLIPKSVYSPRRGLLIARNDLKESSTLVHFDARPDAFFPGHDNADRGIFTFTVFRKTWIADLPWLNNIDSRKHSLMHVDGLAQDEKAPSVRMMKVTDDGEVVLACANLTYAYNVQWARPWPGASPPLTYIVEYTPNGTSKRVPTRFTVPETGDPREFGWPEGDDGSDIGFGRSESNMHGDPDMGFMGMWTWKREYRTRAKVEYGVRSTALVRCVDAPGYFLVVDRFGMTSGDKHVFESYLMLDEKVDVEAKKSACHQNQCMITLKSADVRQQVDIHVMTLGHQVDFRTEKVDTDHIRIVVRSQGRKDELFFMGFNPHDGNKNGFAMSKLDTGNPLKVEVSYKNMLRSFEVSPSSHVLSHVASAKPPMVSQPLAAIPLLFRETVDLDTGTMSNDSRRFLHNNTMLPLQATFKITAKSGRRSRRVERFSTCSRRGTNVETEISVYDCGDADVADERYVARDCVLVAQSGPRDMCRRFRTDLHVDLRKHRPYFVAVGVPEKSYHGDTARVRLTYSLLRTNWG